MDYEKKYNEALERARKLKEMYPQDAPGYEEVFPELRESEDERIREKIKKCIIYDCSLTQEETDEMLAWLEKRKKDNPLEDFSRGYNVGYRDGICDKQKEQKPVIQDVELNDAVYDYVRDHFIAGADFTPEYIKKLMENAFFAGVDYYLLKQESESCEPDTNVEKVIEDVIRVYGKTQGEWVGGYDVDTLIVNLRRAFNKKEQKPAERFAEAREEYEVEWSEEDEKNCNRILRFLEPHKTFFPTKETKEEMQNWLKNRLKSLRPQSKQEWSEEDEATKK